MGRLQNTSVRLRKRWVLKRIDSFIWFVGGQTQIPAANQIYISLEVFKIKMNSGIDEYMYWGQSSFLNFRIIILRHMGNFRIIGIY